MKHILGLLIIIILAIGIIAPTQAQYGRGRRGKSPTDILDNVTRETNEDQRIQDTQLNDVSRNEGSYPSQYRLANTLDSIRIQIAPYIQWAIYMGLSLAVILIIYNGFMLVTHSAHQDHDISKAKTNIINICIGVAVLTGFYRLIVGVVALLTTLTTP